jgi:hypothetical protein
MKILYIAISILFLSFSFIEDSKAEINCSFDKIAIGVSVEQFKSNFNLRDFDLIEDELDGELTNSAQIRIGDICEGSFIKGDLLVILKNDQIVANEVSLLSEERFTLYNNISEYFGEAKHEPNFSKEVKLPYADAVEDEDKIITYQINQINSGQYFLEKFILRDREFDSLLAKTLANKEADDSIINRSIRGGRN